MDREQLLDLLACPTCRGTLSGTTADTSLRCDGCDMTFPVVEGRPVFISPPESVEVRPAEHVSNAISDEIASWIGSHAGPVLNLGAGATDLRFDNVVEGEYAIFRNTDVALDAHCLPFQDGVFFGVVTLNTFEHLRDPAAAAAELVRVMRPGADIWLQTAWLQPLHEAPAHFYGATEYGLREWFRALDVDAVTVPGNMNPGFALSWIVSDVLSLVEAHLGPNVRSEFERMSLADVAEFWAARAYEGPLWDTLSLIPEPAQHHCSAGFELRARKPAAS